MKEAILAFLIALVIGAGINSLPGMAPTPPPTQPEATPVTSETPVTAPSASVASTTDQTFDEDVLKSDQTVVVDFYSDSCAPCKHMAPIFARLAKQYEGKAKFFRLDVNANEATTSRFNVATIPTFIVFSKGHRGDWFTGVVPEAMLTSAIDKTFR